jgi:hypothetical protein
MYDPSNGPRRPQDAVTDGHRVKEQELLEREMSLARKEQSLRGEWKGISMVAIRFLIIESPTRVWGCRSTGSAVQELRDT